MLPLKKSAAFEPLFLEDLPPHVSTVLEVDLTAIRHNFRFMTSQLKGGTTLAFQGFPRCAAVVKADAYGVGMLPVSQALVQVGCEAFFVATIDEGIALKKQLPGQSIFVFNGLLEGTAELFHYHRLIPVLNDLGQIKIWADYCQKAEFKGPAAIHFDTGMSRLGLSTQETNRLIEDLSVLEAFEIHLVMSHLACSERPDHPMNEKQRQRFDEIVQHFPHAPKSLSNSHGMFLGEKYHYDVVRPGRGLYGLGIEASHPLVPQPALQVFARVLQVRDVASGETVGYDATFRADKPLKVATLSLGYADGYLRSLSGKGYVCLGGYKAPVLGVVSMDLVTVDVTGIPNEFCVPGSWAEIIGCHISADEVAGFAGTTSREIMCHLGSRCHRVYQGG